jgi:hypothetical protein
MKNFLELTKEIYDKETAIEVNKALKEYWFTANDLKETKEGILYVERTNVEETKERVDAVYALSESTDEKDTEAFQGTEIQSDSIFENNNKNILEWSDNIMPNSIVYAKNNNKNILEWLAWIDYDTLPWHIIVRDWEGGWYILMNENIWIDKNNPNWGYYTFDEAQKLAPEWYHIPSAEEWEWLYDLGIKSWFWKKGDWETLSKELKLPLAGRRTRGDGSLYVQGSYGYYWSSSPGSTLARGLTFGSSDVRPQYYDDRACGFSVRCFKN